MAAYYVLVACALLIQFNVAHRYVSSSMAAQSLSRLQHNEQQITQGPPMDTLIRHHKHRSLQTYKTTTPKYSDKTINPFLNVSPADNRLHLNKKLLQSKDLIETRERIITPSRLPPGGIGTFNITQPMRRRHFDRELRSPVTRRPSSLIKPTSSSLIKTSSAPPRTIRVRHQKGALRSERQKSVDQLLWADDLIGSSDYESAEIEDNDDDKDYYGDYNEHISSLAFEISPNIPQLQPRFNEKRHSKSNQVVYSKKTSPDGVLKPKQMLRSGVRRKYDNADYESSRQQVVRLY